MTQQTFLENKILYYDLEGERKVFRPISKKDIGDIYDNTEGKYTYTSLATILRVGTSTISKIVADNRNGKFDGIDNVQVYKMTERKAQETTLAKRIKLNREKAKLAEQYLKKEGAEVKAYDALIDAGLDPEVYLQQDITIKTKLSA